MATYFPIEISRKAEDRHGQNRDNAIFLPLVFGKSVFWVLVVVSLLLCHETLYLATNTTETTGLVWKSVLAWWNMADHSPKCIQGLARPIWILRGLTFWWISKFSHSQWSMNFNLTNSMNQFSDPKINELNSKGQFLIKYTDAIESLNTPKLQST